ncbi:MAG: lipopolysaccharide heptosyltransferase II [Deltaproteobacteria bacterium]|nr:lipopolysaccharide heptosyltransferase II [Deltaproteobacteria bacterium]
MVKLSAIGDVVHTLAFLDVLHRNFPQARIDWLVEEGAAGIIEGHPAIRRMIVSRRKSWLRELTEERRFKKVFWEIRSFLKDLRRNRYNCVIDLQGLFKSGIMVGLASGQRKVGMTGAREGASLFLKEPPVGVNYHQHAIDRYLQVAVYLGCKWDRWDNRIPVSESQRHAIDHFLASHGVKAGNLVAINPMAKWKTKLWEPDFFAALADRILTEFSCQVIFTGSKEDRPVIESILSMMKNRALNFAGETGLKELADLYGRCRVLITTDTGPMHMAAAMGCRVVALFGPTSPLRTGPYGSRHKVITSGAECSPCFKKACDQWSCMQNITVDSVFEAVEEILSTGKISRIFEHNGEQRRVKMAISKELLDILACPKCKGDIYLTESEDGLICEHCKLLYEIKEDIPIMLIDEAKPLG